MQCNKYTVLTALLLSVVASVFAAPQHKADDVEIEPRRREILIDSYDDVYDDDSSATTPNPDCDCVCGVPNHKLRIVGGNITKPNEFPWVVALQRKNKFYCGATLVSKRHLVTAAHCIQGFNIKEITTYLGVHNRARLNKAISAGIKSVKVHPKFDLFTFNNDIAVVELDKTISFSSIIRPACLPQDNNDDYAGQQAIVSGWGRIGERETTSMELRKVGVPVMTLSDCRKTDYGKTRITENMICAGYKEGKKDGCQGDSGGPMHVNVGRGTTELIGVVSWGRGCARPNLPGVYTRVGNYIDWINKQIGDQCLCPRP